MSNKLENKKRNIPIKKTQFIMDLTKKLMI